MAKTQSKIASAADASTREKTDAERRIERHALMQASLADGTVITRGYIEPAKVDAPAHQSPSPGIPISIVDRTAAEAGSDLIMRPAAVLIDSSPSEDEAHDEWMADRVADTSTAHKHTDGREAVTDVYGVTVVSAGSLAADKEAERARLLAKAQ